MSIIQYINDEWIVDHKLNVFYAVLAPSYEAFY